MVRYGCDDQATCDKACQELAVMSVRYDRPSMTVIQFREVPVRKVKEVLSRYGFVRDITVHWPTDSQIEALKNRFAVRENHRG